MIFVPGVDEAALEAESSSEELRPELLPRLLLALSGTDTLAEVDFVTDVASTFSWVFTAALFWLEKRRISSEEVMCKCAHWFTQAQILLVSCLSRWVEETRNSNRPCCGRGLILLLLHFLAEPLTAAEPIAALDGSFVLRYDCSDLLLEEGREPQGHTVNLE